MKSMKTVVQFFCGKNRKVLIVLQAPKRSCKLYTLADSKSLINASPLMKYLQSKALTLMRFCMINYQH